MTLHQGVIQYGTWPISGVTVTNEGTGGASFNGTLDANRYVLLPSGATAQTQTANTHYITIPKWSSINNLSAFTLEYGFKYATSGSTIYFWNKGSVFSVNIQSNVLYLHRETTTGDMTEDWSTAFTPVDGTWYDLQISWGAIGATPIVKINDSEKTMYHINHGTGSWLSDSASDATLFNKVSHDFGMLGTFTIVRLHDTNLPTGYLSDNYAADNWRWTETTVNAPVTEATASANAATVARGITQYAPTVEATTSINPATVSYVPIIHAPSVEATAQGYPITGGPVVTAHAPCVEAIADAFAPSDVKINVVAFAPSVGAMAFAISLTPGTPYAGKPVELWRDFGDGYELLLTVVSDSSGICTFHLDEDPPTYYPREIKYKTIYRGDATHDPTESEEITVWIYGAKDSRTILSCTSPVVSSNVPAKITATVTCEGAPVVGIPVQFFTFTPTSGWKPLPASVGRKLTDDHGRADVYIHVSQIGWMNVRAETQTTNVTASGEKFTLYGDSSNILTINHSQELTVVR
jgi:hypothetical protein